MQNFLFSLESTVKCILYLILKKELHICFSHLLNNRSFAHTHCMFLVNIAQNSLLMKCTYSTSTWVVLSTRQGHKYPTGPATCTTYQHTEYLKPGHKCLVLFVPRPLPQLHRNGNCQQKCSFWVWEPETNEQVLKLFESEIFSKTLKTTAVSKTMYLILQGLTLLDTPLDQTRRNLIIQEIRFHRLNPQNSFVLPVSDPVGSATLRIIYCRISDPD